jgi:hypothetical protein
MNDIDFKIVIAKASDVISKEEWLKHNNYILDYFENENVSLKQALFILWASLEALKITSGVNFKVVKVNNSERMDE